MQPPPNCPPRLRTDRSNPFAHHTMAVRVPAIVEQVLERNRDYSDAVRKGLLELCDDLRSGRALPELDAGAPHAAFWLPGLAERRGRGEGWLSTDWFFAENYAYRTLAERVGFWGNRRDPFAATKHEEYASAAFAEAFERALELGLDGSAAPEERAVELLGAALFGNRIDLSFAASRERGTRAGEGDLLADDRERAVELLFRGAAGDGGAAPVHLVIDNAGTELTLDLVFADFAVRVLGAQVVLHLKVHPAFVSDATVDDVRAFVGPKFDGLWQRWSGTARALRERLREALEGGRIELREHGFWNGPDSLWELPAELAGVFRGARLTLLKGDAHYRRALNDAVWAAETPFAAATVYFPGPLLALRMLKSDPIVGLAPGVAAGLDREDPTWRVNGRRGVASLGGTIR